jgi:hypothetical protein
MPAECQAPHPAAASGPDLHCCSVQPVRCQHLLVLALTLLLLLLLLLLLPPPLLLMMLGCVTEAADLCRGVTGRGRELLPLV